MKYLNIFLIFIFTAQISLADCPKVKELNKDDKSPCKGVFFNEDSAQELRKKEKEREKLKRDLTLADLQIKNRDIKADLWKKEAERQRDLREGEFTNYKKGIIVGIVGTVLVFFLSAEVIKVTE